MPVDFAELERHGVNAKFYAASPCKADLIVKRKSCLCRKAVYDADNTVVCKRAVVDMGSLFEIESPADLARIMIPAYYLPKTCVNLVSNSYGVCIADKSTGEVLSKLTYLYRNYFPGNCMPDSPDMLPDDTRKTIAEWLVEAESSNLNNNLQTCQIHAETTSGEGVGINEMTGEVYVNGEKVNSGEIHLKKFYKGSDSVDLGDFKVCVYDGVPASWQNWFGVALGRNLNEGGYVPTKYGITSSDCQLGGVSGRNDNNLYRLCCEIDNCIGIEFENKGKYEETFCFNMYGSDLVGIPWPTHPGF